MAKRGYVICSINERNGQVQVQAIVTESRDGLQARERAEDIADRMRLLPGTSRDIEYVVMEADADASNFELGILENLGEQSGDEFVDAAMLLLKRIGVVQVPKWLSDDWVVEELLKRHNIRARMMPRASRMLRLEASIPSQSKGPTDDGFQETQGTN